jgi:hypothetical protein
MEMRHVSTPADERWVETTGGPFAVLPVGGLRDWDGADGSDYDEACAVEDYLGVLSDRPGGEGAVLIVADEPLPATYISDLRSILQWQYAPTADALLTAARREVGRIEDWETGPVFDCTQSLVLGDASLPGHEWSDGENALRLDLPPGRYACFSGDFTVADEVAGRIHQFRAI